MQKGTVTKKKYSVNEGWKDDYRSMPPLQSLVFAFQLPLFFFFSPPLFWNNGEFGGKNYFTDHWTTNAIHLFVTIKEISFLVFSFSEKATAKANSQETSW